MSPRPAHGLRRSATVRAGLLLLTTCLSGPLLLLHVSADAEETQPVPALFAAQVDSAQVDSAGAVLAVDSPAELDREPPVQELVFESPLPPPPGQVGDQPTPRFPRPAIEPRSCFLVGWPWKAQFENVPPDCLDGVGRLEDVNPELKPYLLNTIGIGAETTGTTALFEYLGRHPKVFAAGERDHFSWENNYRNGIDGFCRTFRLSYDRQVDKLRKEQDRPEGEGGGEEEEEDGDRHHWDHGRHGRRREPVKLVPGTVALYHEHSDKAKNITGGPATMRFSEKSPLQGHYPVAAYRMVNQVPDAKMLFTFRNPIVRACSRFKKRCPSKRQRENGQTFLRGWQPELLENELDHLRDYKRCRATSLVQRLCQGGAKPTTMAELESEEDPALSAPRQCREARRLLGHHPTSGYIETSRPVPPEWTPRESRVPGKMWWDDELPALTRDDAREADRLMSDLLFSGEWSVEEARIVEEDTFFSCNHRFRRLAYTIYPGFIAEHLKRWRFVYPRSSVLLTAQEDLLDHPADVMNQAFAFLGLPGVTEVDGHVASHVHDPFAHKPLSFHELGPKAKQMAHDRCLKSLVDPRELLKAFAPDFPDVWRELGKNLSWEAAVPEHVEPYKCW